MNQGPFPLEPDTSAPLEMYHRFSLLQASIDWNVPIARDDQGPHSRTNFYLESPDQIPTTKVPNESVKV